ncbi:hypothetical protein FKW77_001678 [Venturia effusa]|uniref:AAA+ ATPase domain-containing protein n=1 Tax=Venturia effusa TaxID=50376 RepID=A0A517LNG6_9PEZI|nr:hypothetical protein FKW77_001678 [Venturia effusa]
MAVVAIQRIMTLDKPDHLHPFFQRSETRPPHPPVEEKNDDDADVSVVEGKAAGKKKKKIPKRGARSNGSNQPSLRAFAGLDKASLPTESTSGDPAIATRIQEEPSLEEDPNYGRRKRRKTLSPGPRSGPEGQATSAADDESKQTTEEPATLPWHEQLLVEATKAEGSTSTPSTNVLSVDPHEIPRNVKIVSFHPSTVSHESEVKSDDPARPIVSSADAGIPGNTSDLSVEISRPIEETQADLPTLPARSNSRVLRGPRTPPPNTNTRPIRMIQLKGGKLASPPKPKQEPEKVDAKRRSRGRGKQAKQLLVAIPYGKDGGGTVMGEKINGILNGEERFEMMALDPTTPTKITTSRKALPKKPPSPPKPTHPFFSGKPLPKPTPVISKNDSEDASPRKSSATTPGKIQAEAQAHRVARSIPGCNLAMIAPRPKKVSSTREAPWPAEGIVHARGFMTQCTVSSYDLAASGFHEGRSKRKQADVVVSETEDIIRQFYHGLTPDSDRSVLRVPERVITTGPQLQQLMSAELHTRLNVSKGADSDSEDDVVVRKQQPQQATHPALFTMYAAIETSLSPFDKFECESQAWTQKYAPKCADEVLQQGKEAMVLRDWLKKSTISAVDKGSNRSTTGSHIISTKLKTKPEKKKKRKRPEDLDDFLVSSGDELAESAELEALEDDSAHGLRGSQERSLVRGGTQGDRGAIKSCNAVLVSGPHGCGKTAAIYAVAKELGFEVFELNAGSRRSGKDVLDKVGDMTENHLVQQVSKALSEKTNTKNEKPVGIEIIPDDSPDVKQGSMTSFFKPAVQKKKLNAKKSIAPVAVPKSIEKEAKKDQPRQEQKQSLILLEEVDVLFDEDKQFWLTVIALAAHSKRPIVMTCASENLVPLDSLTLHAILRFTAPPVDLAVDYLLLTAACEGHLLKRAAVESLFRSNGNDIRASLTNLDFWCQIGVGDSAGGFNWMIDRYPPGIDTDKHGNTLRVVSKHTYTNDTGLVSQDLLRDDSCNGAERIESLLTAAWSEWELTPGDVLRHTRDESVSNRSPQSEPSYLQDIEFLADCTSAADLYCGFDMREANQQPLDTTLPELSEKARLDYIVGFPWTLVQADSVHHYSDMDTQLAITNELITHRIRSSLHNNGDSHVTHNHFSIKSQPLEHNLIKTIQRHRSPGQISSQLTRATFSQALDPLAEAPSTSTTAPSAMTASSFDREFSVITTDLAPYVRSIAAYDIAIEQQRMKIKATQQAEGMDEDETPSQYLDAIVEEEQGVEDGLTREELAQEALDEEIIGFRDMDIHEQLEGDGEEVIEVVGGELDDMDEEDLQSSLDIIEENRQASLTIENDDEGADFAHIERLKQALQPYVAGVARSVESESIRWFDHWNTQGYEALIEEALKKEQVLSMVLTEEKEQVMLDIISSMDRRVLEGIMIGNLVHTVDNNVNGIQGEMDRIKAQAAHAPGIYLMLFVDENGDSPTPKQILKMLEYVEQYIDEDGDNDWSEEIDSLKGAARVTGQRRIQDGYRKYLARSDKDNKTPSEIRIKRFNQFRKNLIQRFRLLSPALLDEPLVLPLSEVGYANDCEGRFQDHASHESSNYIMNLMEAICIWLAQQGEPGFEKNFQIRQFIIYNCWEVEQGVIAEIVFSILGHAYIYNGGGFNHYPAGLSNASCRKKNPYWVGWYELQDYTYHFSPWTKNLAWEGDLRKARNDEYLADLERQIKQAQNVRFARDQEILAEERAKAFEAAERGGRTISDAELARQAEDAEMLHDLQEELEDAVAEAKRWKTQLRDFQPLEQEERERFQDRINELEANLKDSSAKYKIKDFYETMQSNNEKEREKEKEYDYGALARRVKAVEDENTKLMEQLKLDKAEGKQEKTKDKLATTKEELGKVEGKLKEAEGKLGTAEGKLGEAEAKLEEAMGKLAVYMERYGEL